jgi:hypothetical protein
MQTQQSPSFCENELAVVQDSFEPIKWHHVIHLLLNRHDMWILKPVVYSSSSFYNTANGCT